MKKVWFLRERLYRTEEFEVDPNEPDRIVNFTPVFGNEDDEGFWNEYYRVVVCEHDGDPNGEDCDSSEDFYSYQEAVACYNERVKKVKMENIEACGVDKATLRERYC